MQLYGGVFNSSGTAFKTTGSVKDMLASNFFFYRGEEGSEKLVENEAELSASSLGNNERFTVLMGQHGQVVATVTTNDGTMENFTMGDGLTAEQALAEAMDYADSIGKSTLTLQRSVDIDVYKRQGLVHLRAALARHADSQPAAADDPPCQSGQRLRERGEVRPCGLPLEPAVAVVAVGPLVCGGARRELGGRAAHGGGVAVVYKLLLHRRAPLAQDIGNLPLRIEPAACQHL